MSKSILISIHPKYVDDIIRSKKVFEYRKSLPREDVDQLVIYATAPVKKIVAVVQVLRTLNAKPNLLWRQTSKGSGIDKKFFDQYFANIETAHAFHLGKVTEVVNGIELQHLESSTPPQSFRYLSAQEVQLVGKAMRKATAFRDKLIFIGGIHGAGKSYFAEKNISPYGFECLSASTIIKDGGNSLSKSKRVKDLDDNQRKLLIGLAKYQKDHPRIALDGHFALINSQKIISKVDAKIFHAINPDSIIIKTASVGTIQERLCKRDGYLWDQKLIADFQQTELEHGQCVARELNVPCHILDDNINPNAMDKLLNLLISKP